MSSKRPVSRKYPGGGWLVLSGEVPAFGEAFPHLAELLLQSVDLTLPVLAWTPSWQSAVKLAGFLEEIEILIETEPVVYTFDDPPDPTLMAAGLVLLAGGTAREWQTALDESALEAILLKLLGNGAMLIVSGAAAACLGDWVVPASGAETLPGCGWLPGGLILTEQEDPLADDRVRLMLMENAHSYALALPALAAVAVGPQGELEVWSARPPKLVLGSGWTEI